MNSIWSSLNICSKPIFKKLAFPHCCYIFTPNTYRGMVPFVIFPWPFQLLPVLKHRLWLLCSSSLPFLSPTESSLGHWDLWHSIYSTDTFTPSNMDMGEYSLWDRARLCTREDCGKARMVNFWNWVSLSAGGRWTCPPWSELCPFLTILLLPGSSEHSCAWAVELKLPKTYEILY